MQIFTISNLASTTLYTIYKASSILERSRLFNKSYDLPLEIIIHFQDRLFSRLYYIIYIYIQDYIQNDVTIEK